MGLQPVAFILQHRGPDSYKPSRAEWLKDISGLQTVLNPVSSAVLNIWAKRLSVTWNSGSAIRKV